MTNNNHVRYCTECGARQVPVEDWKNSGYSLETGELISKTRTHKCPDAKFLNLRGHTKSTLYHNHIGTTKEYFNWFELER